MTRQTPKIELLRRVFAVFNLQFAFASPSSSRDQREGGANRCTNLREPDVLALFPKALAADVEPVFSDQTGFVGAYSAGKGGRQ